MNIVLWNMFPMNIKEPIHLSGFIYMCPQIMRGIRQQKLKIFSILCSLNLDILSCIIMYGFLCQSIEINNNKCVYRQSQVRMPNGSGVRWADCLLIIGTGCRVQVFCLILDSSVGLSAGIRSAEDWVSETLWVRILHSAEEENLSPFDSKIACLCQSIEINNKYVYRQSQVRMPNGSGVRWAECLLIIATGCRVQIFCLILDSSVGLSAGIRSAEDWVSETLWVRILHSAEEDNLSPFDSKNR